MILGDKSIQRQYYIDVAIKVMMLFSDHKCVMEMAILFVITANNFFVTWFVLLTCTFSGNDYLNDITSQARYVLRIDMEDFENETKYEEYSNFAVDSESNKYKLSFGTHSGTAGKQNII